MHSHNGESRTNEFSDEYNPRDLFGLATGKEIVNFVVTDGMVRMALATQETGEATSARDVSTQESFAAAWYRSQGIQIENGKFAGDISLDNIQKVSQAIAQTYSLVYFAGPIGSRLNRVFPE